MGRRDAVDDGCRTLPRAFVGRSGCDSYAWHSPERERFRSPRRPPPQTVKRTSGWGRYVRNLPDRLVNPHDEVVQPQMEAAEHVPTYGSPNRRGLGWPDTGGDHVSLVVSPIHPRRA